jgi:hypothetical protein
VKLLAPRGISPLLVLIILLLYPYLDAARDSFDPFQPAGSKRFKVRHIGI